MANEEKKEKRGQSFPEYLTGIFGASSIKWWERTEYDKDYLEPETSSSDESKEELE